MFSKMNIYTLRHHKISVMQICFGTSHIMYFVYGHPCPIPSQKSTANIETKIAEIQNMTKYLVCGDCHSNSTLFRKRWMIILPNTSQNDECFKEFWKSQVLSVMQMADEWWSRRHTFKSSHLFETDYLEFVSLHFLIWKTETISVLQRAQDSCDIIAVKFFWEWGG